MAKFEYLLTISDSRFGDLDLTGPCCADYGGNGELIPLNTVNPHCFGEPYLSEKFPDIVWRAVTPFNSIDRLKDVYGFHGGAMVSPRARELIEAENVPNIEFIPLEIRKKGYDRIIAKWWYVNVFNWKNVFDFTTSVAEFVEFYNPHKGLESISSRFGDKSIKNIKLLSINVDQIGDGLFLAKGTSEKIWHNVFISEKLARKINEGRSKNRRSYFSHYYLDEGPGPKFDLRPYHYAGSRG